MIPTRINHIIINSKYFPVSDWLKPHAQFTITSCCFPNLERIFAILNQWHQKCSPPKMIEPMMSKVQPAADYWTVDRENLGTRLCYIWWAEKHRAKWQNSFKKEEIFWMKNKAIIELGFRRIWRILQISEGVIHLGLQPLWITPSLICRILHILLSLLRNTTLAI